MVVDPRERGRCACVDQVHAEVHMECMHAKHCTQAAMGKRIRSKIKLVVKGTHGALEVQVALYPKFRIIFAHFAKMGSRT